MKKLYLILLLLIACIAGFGQNKIFRANASNTVIDARLGARLNFLLPQYLDTTAANVDKGIDSCGALIYTYTGNFVWYRACSPKRWIKIIAGASIDNIYTIDGSLTGNRLLTGAGYKLGFTGLDSFYIRYGTTKRFEIGALGTSMVSPDYQTLVSVLDNGINLLTTTGNGMQVNDTSIRGFGHVRFPGLSGTGSATDDSIVVWRNGNNGELRKLNPSALNYTAGNGMTLTSRVFSAGGATTAPVIYNTTGDKWFYWQDTLASAVGSMFVHGKRSSDLGFSVLNVADYGLGIGSIAHPVASFLAPNITAGHLAYITLGKSANAGNTNEAFLTFMYQGNNSDSNRLMLSFANNVRPFYVSPLGRVGIMTPFPLKTFHSTGTMRLESLGAASTDTTTYKPLGIASNGDVIPMTYWPGSGAGGTNPADSVQDYTGLRAYTGTAKYLVNTDSRTGGLFYRVAAGSENGAALIVATNGIKWQRMFDNVHWKPEFFEILGYDENGAAYNRLTGTGIGSEAEAIDKICKIAGREAIIEYIPNKTYPIDRYVRAIQRQLHIGGIWQRATPVTTLLTNNEAINSTTVEVVDASNFQTGMGFLIKGAGTTGDYNTTSSGTAGVEYHTITSISGNTLTISGSVYPISKAMLAGDTVVSVSSLIYRENSILGSSDTNNIVYLRNMTFDGNKAANRYFTDYQQPATIEMFGGYIEAQSCTFKNIPGENLYMAGGRFVNCFAYYTEGSVFHGTNNQQTIDSIYQDLYVENLVADSIGLGDPNKQGHSEGTLVTGSTKTMNSLFVNCIVKNAGQFTGSTKVKPLFAVMTADDGIVSVTGGHYEKCAALGSWRGIDSLTAKGKRMTIQGATFMDCNYLEMTGTNIRQGNGLDGLLITNNKFRNVRFYFADIANFEFSNNEVSYDSLTYIAWRETLASGSTGTTWGGMGQGATMYLSPSMDRVTIKNNSFSAFANDSIATGINVTLDNTVITKDGASSTNFYYGQNFDISGNRFNGFRNTLATGITAYTKSTVGWTYNDNFVAMGKGSGYAADYTVGIRVPPGAIANNNTVVNFYNTAYSWPFVAEGVSANQTTIIGSILTNNKVYGNMTNAYYISPFDNSPYNVTLKNNTRTGGIITGGALGLANSFRTGNDILDSGNLPSLTAPINPVTHRVRENKSNY